MRSEESGLHQPVSYPVEFVREQSVTRPRQPRPQVLDISQPPHYRWLHPTVPDPGGVGHVGGQVDPAVEDGVHLGVLLHGQNTRKVSPAPAPVVPVVSVSRPPASPHLHITRAVNMKTWPSLRTPGLHQTLVDGEIVNLPHVRATFLPEQDFTSLEVENFISHLGQ